MEFPVFSLDRPYETSKEARGAQISLATTVEDTMFQ